MESALSKTNIPYKRIFLIVLLLSNLTVNVNNINVAIGDILLIILDILLVTYFLNNISVKKCRVEYMKKGIAFFLIFLFLCYCSLAMYIYTGLPIQKGVIELLKLTVAINYGVVFLSYFMLASEADEQDFLKYMVISAMFVAITGIIGVALYNIGIDNPLVMNGQRAKGTMSDTNIMAIFLITVLPLVTVSLKIKKKKIVAGTLLLAILSTGSKAAILVLGLLFFILLLGNLRLRNYKQVTIFVVITIISAFVIIKTFSQNDMFSFLFNRIGEFASGDLSVITTGRTDLWKFAFSLLKNPIFFLFGIGYGAFGNYLYGMTVPYYLEGISLVHNTFLSILVETGIVNFICLLLGTCSIFLKTIKYFFRSKSVFWLLILISEISLLIGLNEVNLQNNRFVYYLLAYYYFCVKMKENL